MMRKGKSVGNGSSCDCIIDLVSSCSLAHWLCTVFLYVLCNDQMDWKSYHVNELARDLHRMAFTERQPMIPTSTRLCFKIHLKTRLNSRNKAFAVALAESGLN